MQRIQRELGLDHGESSLGAPPKLHSFGAGRQLLSCWCLRALHQDQPSWIDFVTSHAFWIFLDLFGAREGPQLT